MGSIGTTEILIIALIVIILFGARRIPELAKGLGEGIRNFKAGMKSGDETREIEDRKYQEEVQRREESRRSV
jgi:sec-independent protein translocase protein TatA